MWPGNESTLCDRDMYVLPVIHSEVRLVRKERKGAELNVLLDFGKAWQNALYSA